MNVLPVGKRLFLLSPVVPLHKVFSWVCSDSKVRIQVSKVISRACNPTTPQKLDLVTSERQTALVATELRWKNTHRMVVRVSVQPTLPSPVTQTGQRSRDTPKTYPNTQLVMAVLGLDPEIHIPRLWMSIPKPQLLGHIFEQCCRGAESRLALGMDTDG